VRGYEDTSPTAGLTLASGVTLPRGARLKLYRHEAARVEPYDFITLANISAGTEGLLYLTSIALETGPPYGQNSNETWSNGASKPFRATNNYIEGCWHMTRSHSEKLPGLTLGTGFEDYFDTTFGFSLVGPDPRDPSQGNFSNEIQRTCNGTVNPVGHYDGVCESQGVLFQHSESGLLHFSSDTSDDFAIDPLLLVNSSTGQQISRGGDGACVGKGPCPLRGVERISAYRFLDREVISFEDGGTVQWRNSDFEPKCYALTTPGKEIQNVSPVLVRSYAWVYEWPKQEE